MKPKSAATVDARDDLQYTCIDAIAYRGDTREPDEIFVSGLKNKQNPDYQWFKLVSTLDFDDLKKYGPKDDIRKRLRSRELSDADAEAFGDSSKVNVEPLQHGKTEYKISLIGAPEKFFILTLTKRPAEVLRKDMLVKYFNSKARFRWNDQNPSDLSPTDGMPMEDIDPKTAVCLTLKPQVAPYFPIEGNNSVDGEWIWIYVTRLGAAIKTFTYQAQYGERGLETAREVAVAHVPSSHVLCAVHCWRKGVYPTMEFTLSPHILWNPCASASERVRSRAAIETALWPFQCVKTICVASQVQGQVRDGLRVIYEPASPSRLTFE
jgi:hypothetical protein